METNKINTAEPFTNLFRIYEEDYRDILKDMESNGFDPNEPLLLWKEEDVVIDGHTRLKSAKECGIKDIPVNLLSFEDEQSAIRYSVKRNKNKGRRTTAGDNFRLMKIMDNPGSQGGDHCSEEYKKQNLNLNFASNEAKEAKESAKQTAKLIGIGYTNIIKMRTILNYGTEEDIEDVENDEMSIDAAWKEAKREKEKIEAELRAASNFNRTTDSIEWALWTWNPVTGCEHNCKYCYARDIAERFYKQGFEPTFHLNRLTAPKDTPVPKIDELGEHNVFVCSMADLFGDWVEDKWIEDIFESISNAPDWWNFLLLTKNPERYLKLDFPENCWIGATATNQKEMDRAIKVFDKLKKKINNILFISCEPLMEKIETDLSSIDWLIIGGRSKSKGMPAGQPKWEWVEELIWQAREDNTPVYAKPNLTIKPKEYPKTV